MQDLLTQIQDLQSRLQKAWDVIDIPEKRQHIALLQKEMTEPSFWTNQSKAKTVSQLLSGLEDDVRRWEKLQKDLQELLDITKLDKDDQTVSLRSDVEKQIKVYTKQFQQLEFDLLFKDKRDHGSAIVAIHSGAGGTDAQDWAEMLLRMYLRFCEKQNWKTQIINTAYGQEAGIKNVLFEVTGKNAYGYLKAEAGVHRLVRISPFDAEKMRHTSFALVEVLPLVEEVTAVEIKPDELRFDTFRAGGRGGQSVNTTDSAVRLTHLPTGIVVTCQNERSQMQNRETAMRVLRSKLKKYYEAELEEERQKLRGEYTEAAWGNQARSYVIHPYKMVKDHRTDFEVTDVTAVLDGDLIEFIETYLRQNI